jgi:hypothetical protein
VSTTSRVVLDVEAIGFSALEVDGEDMLGKVQGFRLESIQGQPTVLTLWLSVKGEANGDALVHAETPMDMARFVEQLDPEQVEKAAIERSHLDPSSSLTKLMLDVVADAARGKA